MREIPGRRWLWRGVLPLVVALSGTALAEPPDAGPPPPVLVGPVVVAPAGATVPAATYGVAFLEGARTARVQLAFQIPDAAVETVLGFAGREISSIVVTVDGVPATVEPSSAPLPVGGGPFDRQVLVRLPPGAGTPRSVVFEARCDTRLEVRDPQLTYPQATFILNRLLEGPRARVLRLDPGAAARGDVRVRVETIAPQWPEAPVGGERTETPTGEAVEGPSTAEPGTAIEVAAIEGEYAQPKDGGVQVGIGIGLDWPHFEKTETNAAGLVTERWYETPGIGDPTTRIWFRGAYQHAFGKWLLGAGLEGDPGGALELPLTLTWFPQERSPGTWDVFADYRFTFGLAFQVFNDRSPFDYAFDPRVFLRVGAGIRLFLLTVEALYEIAPPVGDWNGPHGLLEHKLLIVFPWAF